MPSLKVIHSRLERQEFADLFCKDLRWSRAAQNLLVTLKPPAAVAAGLLAAAPVTQIRGITIIQLDWPDDRLPQWPDLEPNPKELVVALARKSRKRDIREEKVPVVGGASKLGRNYVGQLMRFAAEHWQVNTPALKRSPSLCKALRAIQEFKPQMPENN